MTDADRCKLIAEFEGLPFLNPYADYPTTAAATPNGPFVTINYPHDLNATMRAARKLPEGNLLVLICGKVQSESYITIANGLGSGPVVINTNPARAAFLALTGYLAERK
jgi:hypothetical protein